jgi:AraC-like DNA-binding protein
MRESTVENYQKVLEAAKKYIKENISDSSMVLEDFCVNEGVSVRHAQRSFRHYSTSWRRLTAHIKMQKASKLLRETNEPIKTIAHKVGYRRSEQFAIAFRRECGVTPGDYRRAVNGGWR